MRHLNFALYGERCLYPGGAAPVERIVGDLKRSGVRTLILGAFHFGRDFLIRTPQTPGDLYYNDALIISNGAYVGPADWPNAVNAMIGGGIAAICASIGGGAPEMDFETIAQIYDSHRGSFAGSNLESCLRILRKTFPVIGALEIDCRGSYDPPSFVAFCELAINLGYNIIFRPSAEPPFWADALAVLEARHPGAVKWWTLQLDGGSVEPGDWIAAIKARLPGFSTRGFFLPALPIYPGASAIDRELARFKGDPDIGGASVCKLDKILEDAPADPLTEIRRRVAAMTRSLRSSHRQSIHPPALSLPHIAPAIAPSSEIKPATGRFRKN